MIDNQFSRIGFATKKGRFCEPQSSEDFITLNDNANVRLVLNVLFLGIILGIAFKVTGGCLQFYDFGSSGGSGQRGAANGQAQGNG